MLKILKISLLIFCGIAFLLAFTAESQAATVTFSADTALDLTGDTPAVRINTGSTCNSLIVTDTTVTADVEAGGTFTLETSTYTVLGLTPTGGTTTLAFDTANYSNYVTQWVASSTASAATTSFSVGGRAGHWYTVSVDGSELGSYLADGSTGVVSFNYTGGYSSAKTFTISQEDPASVGVGPSPIISETEEEETTEEEEEVEEEEELIEEEEEEETTKPISEMTIEELQAKIAEILAQINILQAELSGVTEEVVYEGIPAGFTFQSSLKFGAINEDVRSLQIVLNFASDTRLAESAVGSPGHETNYFGPLTKAAVIKFQEKHSEDILAPWGIAEGTGFVGETTRAKLNELLGR